MFSSSRSRTRSKESLRRLAGALASLLVLMTLVDVQAETYTWNVADDGDWKVASNWDPSTGFPAGSGDTAILAGDYTVTYTESGSSTLAAQVTGSGSVRFTGGGTVTFNNTGNDFTGTVILDGTRVSRGSASDGMFGDDSNEIIFRNNGGLQDGAHNWDPAAGRVLTIESTGGNIFMNGIATMTIDDENQLQGDGLLHFEGGQHGSSLSISAAQPNFSGGFLIDNSIDIRRHADLSGDGTAGAFGSGLVSGISQGQITYHWGAQLAGGAGDGGKAGVAVSDWYTVRLAGGASSSDGDRFVIYPNGAIRGTSARLPEVTRVSAFTGGSGASPEAILYEDAIVVHETANNTTTMANLGTQADLLFGIDPDITDAGFALAIGAGTPWKGFANYPRGAHTGTSTRDIRTGTITIHDGGGSFTEMVLQATGRDFGGEHHMVIGDGANAPTFTASGDPVPCRILSARYPNIGGVDDKGDVTGRVLLESTSPDYSGGISRWIAGGPDSGYLQSNVANGFDGIPVEIAQRGFVQQRNGHSTIDELIVSGWAQLMLVSTTSLTANDLSLDGHGVLFVRPFGQDLGHADLRFFVDGYPEGKVKDHPIVLSPNNSVSSGWQKPELADYSATDGFTIAAYDTTDINSADQGDFVKITGSNQTLSSDRSLLGLVVGRTIAGSSQTLTVGRKSDGEFAPYGMVLGHNDGTPRIDPDLDFGDSAGVLFFRQVGWNTRFDIYGAVKGSNGLMIVGGVEVASTGNTYPANRAIRLRNTANAISGQVTLLDTYTHIESGNGLAGADVDIRMGATLSQGTVSQTVNSLTGGGTIRLGSGRMLTVADTFRPGDAFRNPLDCTTAGTLELAAGSQFVVDLDVTDRGRDHALTELGDAALSIDVGVTLHIENIRNPDAMGDDPYTILTADSISGEFDTVSVDSALGVNGIVTVDNASTPQRILLTFVPRQSGSLFLMR